MTLILSPADATRQRVLAEEIAYGRLAERGRLLVETFGAAHMHTDAIDHAAVALYLARGAERLAHGGVPTRAALGHLRVVNDDNDAA